jgi:hypothetical protein
MVDLLGLGIGGLSEHALNDSGEGDAVPLNDRNTGVESVFDDNAAVAELQVLTPLRAAIPVAMTAPQDALNLRSCLGDGQAVINALYKTQGGVPAYTCNPIHA